MTNRKWIFLFIAPILLLLGLILWRGKATRPTPPGVIRIRGTALRASAAIWTNREFIRIANNEDRLHTILANFIAPLSVSDSARSNAVVSSIGIIKAYGTGNWDDFLRVRIPVAGYEVEKDAIGPYGLNIADKKGADVNQSYQAYWKKTFQESPLFSEVSFLSNSISIFDLPWDKLGKISTPEFTDPANRNWVEKSLTKVYDYKKPTNSNGAKILRLFFFTKDNQIPGFVQVVFVWNEHDGVWLPWRFTLGIVQKPAHDLYLF